MLTQAVRLSICRNPQEIANAKTRDNALGFVFNSEQPNEIVNVGMLINIPANGLVRELYVHIEANAAPTPAAPTPAATASAPSLTLVISTKA